MRICLAGSRNSKETGWLEYVNMALIEEDEVREGAGAG